MPSPPIASPTASASSRATGRSSAPVHTTGQTSRAPMHGCAPSWRRMSMATAQAPAPRDRASPRRLTGAARVRTVRLWTGSECESSSSAPDANWAVTALTRDASRPSEKLGTERSTSDQQLAGSHQRLAVDRHVGLGHHAVDVDRDLDGAPHRGVGAERDVRGAEDLLVLEQVAGEDRLLVG